MTDNQKTELEEAIEGLEHDYRVGNTVNPNDLDFVVDAAKKYADLSDYILIRRDDVPEGLGNALQTGGFIELPNMYGKADLTKLEETARLVQAAMEDK